MRNKVWNLTLRFLRISNFSDNKCISVLEKLKYRWVKINRGGPETLEGVLNEANDDFVTIISNEEIIRIATFHIRNISYGVKIEKTKSEESESNKNKDGSNKTNESKEKSDNSNKKNESKEKKR